MSRTVKEMNGQASIIGKKLPGKLLRGGNIEEKIEEKCHSCKGRRRKPRQRKAHHEGGQCDYNRAGKDGVPDKVGRREKEG